MNESQSFQCDPKAIEAWCRHQEQALAAVMEGRANMVPINKIEQVESKDVPGMWLTMVDGVVTDVTFITHDISQHE